MPVGNQWRTRGGRSATVTEEPTPPPKDPEPAGPHGKRIGRLQNFRTKSQDKAPEPAPAAKDSAAADGEQPSSGKKTLGEKWSAASAQDDGKTVRKKRLEVTETATDGGAEVTDPANVGIIIENEPVRLEGVVRSDDPSEFTKPLEVEKGFAKNLANRFLQQQQEDAAPSGAARFRMDIAAGEGEVHENEPVRLEGVVRSGEKTQDVVGKRGAIKNIAGRFACPRDSDSENSSDDHDDAAHRRRHAQARRPVAPISDSTGSDAVVLSENVPTELDPSIVRSTDGYRANDPVMESGRTRNMAERWRQQQEEQESASTGSGGGGGRSAKPAWLVELENAKESEYGVFENEPEVRDDVIRADDDTPDVISVQHTRSLRQMWTQIERDKDLPPSRPPPVKPKEPSPEPPKPPPEEPKPAVGRFGVRRPVGRLQGFGQMQKEEPAPPATPPGKGVADGKGVRGKAPPTAAPAAQPTPLELETKSSKLYVKPSLKPIQKKK